jgi:hypothetical protein
MAEMFNPEGLEAGLENEIEIPTQLQPLVGEEPASDYDEQIMGEATIAMYDWLYSDKGMQSVVNMMKQDSRELFEVIPDIAVPLLEKVRNEIPEAGADTFFADGGLIQQVVEELLDLAKQENLPGAHDPDQEQAVIVNLYRKIGEILERDPSSKEGAAELGSEMLRTKDDGSLMSEEKLSKAGQLGNQIRQGLLG